MTSERRRLAIGAASAALRLRQRANIPPDQPCNVFDLAEQQGVEVRFAALPSAEGIYSPGKPVIVISSLRPSGRQAYTGAHELGHHIYGHGEQFDELVEERGKSRRWDPKEYEANCFASALLMPRTAILKGLTARGWSLADISSGQVFRLACWLGVGYMTLVGNLSQGTHPIDSSLSSALEKIKVPTIRRAILGYECKEPLVVVDKHWTGRSIDAQQGDLILLPPNTVLEGQVATTIFTSEAGVLVRAVCPGIGRVSAVAVGWAGYIRICRKQFTGLAKFRHLEEAEDE